MSRIFFSLRNFEGKPYMSYCKFHPLLVKKLLLSGHQWQVEIIDLKMTLTSRTLALNLRDDFLKGVRIVLLFKKHILKNENPVKRCCK